MELFHDFEVQTNSRYFDQYLYDCGLGFNDFLWVTFTNKWFQVITELLLRYCFSWHTDAPVSWSSRLLQPTIGMR